MVTEIDAELYTVLNRNLPRLRLYNSQGGGAVAGGGRCRRWVEREHRYLACLGSGRGLGVSGAGVSGQRSDIHSQSSTKWTSIAGAEWMSARGMGCSVGAR